MTLVELVIGLALASAVLVVATTFSIPMLARESMRSATYDVQMAMQVARVEAVTRNHDCRLTIQRVQRWVEVEDLETNEVLYRAALPRSVVFARPTAGRIITIPRTGELHRTTFQADGTVTSGGWVHVHGGDRYSRLSLFGAGGVQIEKWNGSTWVPGS